MPKVLTDYVTADDGTALGYRVVGQGPGLVLLHGAMSSGYNHVQLAEALADAFTVYLPDRRGRGLSGPYRDEWSVQHDVDDLAALLAETGAHHVFGVSSGGLVCLEAALTLPTVHSVAVYEPPLFLDPSVPAAVLARFDEQLADGRLTAALVTGMKGARLGPRVFAVLPQRLLMRLTAAAMAGEERKASRTSPPSRDGQRPADGHSAGYVTMRALAPTLHYDFALSAAASGAVERYRDLPASLLLLGGSKSPAYLKTALDALADAVPAAERRELVGLDHAASWNTDRRGNPGPVARELREFFARQLA